MINFLQNCWINKFQNFNIHIHVIPQKLNIFIQLYGFYIASMFIFFEVKIIYIKIIQQF